MAEALETHYGISRVVLHGTQNKGKAARLRAVSPMLEHSDPSIPAKVMFKGRYPEGEDGQPDKNAPLQLHPDMKRLHDYIVNFAVMSGFHSLDAATQLIAHMVREGDLAVHEGEFTRQVQRGQYRALSAKKVAKLQRAMADYALPQSDEYAWFGAPNNPSLMKGQVMDKIEGVANAVTPVNKQVVLIKDTEQDTNEAGLYIGDSVSRKLRSGVVAAFADDCDIPLQSGVRVGYQRHAGSDMTIIADGDPIDVIMMPENSITMILASSAKLGVSDD